MNMLWFYRDLLVWHSDFLESCNPSSSSLYTQLSQLPAGSDFTCRNESSIDLLVFLQVSARRRINAFSKNVRFCLLTTQ